MNSMLSNRNDEADFNASECKPQNLNVMSTNASHKSENNGQTCGPHSKLFYSYSELLLAFEIILFRVVAPI